jgi:CRP-like cAMP-binding protein
MQVRKRAVSAFCAACSNQRRGPEFRAGKGDGTMQPEARSVRSGASAHPLAELLACPPEASNLLNASAQQVEFVAGDTIFHQDSPCRGLYVVASGQLLRKADRLQVRLVLGPVRVGDLVELAAALGDGLHTFTLVAQSAGSLMLLPMEALNRTFQMYPPLRMHLLEELAREVSRAYLTCCATRMAGLVRRRGTRFEAAQS